MDLHIMADENPAADRRSEQPKYFHPQRSWAPHSSKYEPINRKPTRLRDAPTALVVTGASEAAKVPHRLNRCLRIARLTLLGTLIASAATNIW